MGRKTFFPPEEYATRLQRVRSRMAALGLEGLLVSAPESIYYLCGLDHMGHFAPQALLVPIEGRQILVTRAMERATVRDQVPDVEHIGYAEDAGALPSAEGPQRDLVMETRDARGDAAGLRPWDMSLGHATRGPGPPPPESDPARALGDSVRKLRLEESPIGIEKDTAHLPLRVTEQLFWSLPRVRWIDASNPVGDCRLVQSERELACTRQAAVISDAMLLAAIAAAGPGIPKRDVTAAVYATMMQRGGTYPGFPPLVRSTRTLEHEHGTWDGSRLASRDLLFLEMSGCVRRYHAPIGRLVFIGRAPDWARRMLDLCREAMERAAGAIGPGVQADEVYRVWQDCLNRTGLSSYTRHHCGYAVGIGYPPSWSGGGVPQGLRAGSTLELRQGMVFHLMSWLLRTGRGDSFLSDTVVVTDRGCDFLTTVSRELTVR